jgi:hypothetical protein
MIQKEEFNMNQSVTKDDFGKNKNEPQKHKEGPVAKTIEKQTAKLPSDLFLWTAVGAIAASAALQASQKKELSLFVGQWAPVLLILGLYNKIVKVAGSDRTETQGKESSSSFEQSLAL